MLKHSVENQTELPKINSHEKNLSLIIQMKI